MDPTVELTVVSGTTVAVEFEETLSSDTNRPGDRFRARVVEPVYVGDRVAIDAGSTVTGRVAEASTSRRIGGRARLGLDFDRLKLGSGDEVVIEASFHGQARSQTAKDAATIGGAAAGGALLGRIIGHHSDREARGTTVGALLGTAVGTAIAASDPGQAVTIPEGTVLRIRLDAPVTVTVTADRSASRRDVP
jgi:hypothetical protein